MANSSFSECYSSTVCPGILVDSLQNSFEVKDADFDCPRGNYNEAFTTRKNFVLRVASYTVASSQSQTFML